MKVLAICVIATLLSLVAYGVSWVHGVNPDAMAGWVAIGAVSALYVVTPE